MKKSKLAARFSSVFGAGMKKVKEIKKSREMKKI